MKLIKLSCPKDKNKLLVFILYLIITLVVMRDLLFSPGMIMYYVNPVIPPFNFQLIERAYTRSFMWVDESLGRGFAYPSEIYFDYLIGILGLLGFNGEILSKLFMFLCILFSGIFMYMFTKKLEFSNKSAFISGLFYMISPVVFTKILESHLFYLVGYTLSPIIFLLFVSSIKGNEINIKPLVLSGLLFAFAISQLQFFFMLLALITMYTLLMVRQKLIVKFTALSVFFLICLLIHLPWLLPLLSNPNVVSSVAAREVTFGSFEDTSLSPVDAFRIIGFYFPFFKNSAIQLVPFWNIISIIAVAMIFVPLLIRPNKNILFFSGMAVLSIFIVSGFKSPFSELFVWAVKNIFLTGIFREVYHLTFFIAFSYSVLLGSAVTAFEVLLSKYIKLGNATEYLSFLILVAIILLFLGPFFSGNLGGNMHPYDYKEYKQLFDYFIEQEGDFKVLMLPMDHIVKYDSSWKEWGSDVMQQLFPKSVLDPYQNEGSDSHRVVGYIYRKINNDGLSRSPASIYYLSKDVLSEAKLLALVNVKYVILRKNIISILNNYFELVKNKLSSSNDFKLVKSYNNESILIFENSRFIPTIYTSNEMNLLVGDMSMTDNLSPFVSIQQLEKKEIPFTGIYLNREYYMDYLSAFVPEEYNIKLIQYAMKPNPYNDWAPYFRTWWDDPRFTKSLEKNIVITKKSGANLTLWFDAENTSDYVLLTKYSLGGLWDYLPDSGFIIYLNGKQIKTFDTEEASLGDITWSSLILHNLSQGKHKLTIENIGNNKNCVGGCSVEGESVILRLIIVPSNILQDSFQKAESYLNKTTKDFDIPTIPEYKKISLDGFKKGSSDYPGEIKVQNDIAEFSFQVNKSRNRDSGFGFIGVFDSEDWTNFNKLTFQFYTENSTDCDVLIDIYSDRYYKEKGDLIRYWIGRFSKNGWKKITVDLSQVPRDDIDQLYFQIGDGICNQDGKKVTLKFSNFTLVNDTPIFNSIYRNESVREINVEKENPTYYKLNVDSTTPFFLIFGESYNDKWKAFVNDKYEIPNEYHFVANGFANAWYVNKTGNFTIILEYTPQRLFNLGLEISLTIIIILIAIMIIPERELRLIMKRKL